MVDCLQTSACYKLLLNILERRAVYSFLNTLYDGDDDLHNQPSVEQHRKLPKTRFPSRTSTTVLPPTNYSTQRRLSNNGGHESRASKRDLGEILESLER